MNWKYEDYLIEQIYKFLRELDLDIKYEVCEEQIFAKKKTLSPETIYVVIKYLSADISLESITQPVNILVLSEENEMKSSQMIFNKIADNLNWKVVIDGTTFIKQQYSTPVVLNNFSEINAGYRSVLYLTSTLMIMENVVDIDDGTNKGFIKIDGESIKPLNFNISYNMTPNSQPVGGNLLATSVKSVSSLGLSLVLPMQSIYSVINKATNIMCGSISGNSKFAFYFKLNNSVFQMNMRMSSSQIISSPNSVPSIQLGFLL